MPEVTARLEIILSDNGQVAVNGPIENRMLCYGLLGLAYDSIQEFNAARNAAAQQRVSTPTAEEVRIALSK